MYNIIRLHTGTYNFKITLGPSDRSGDHLIERFMGWYAEHLLAECSSKPKL
jgi:hypothetical protein